MTLSAISRRLAASSFFRRPPTRPSARAAARPAEVRSRIIARSNSANDATICIIMRPAGEVVSMFSVSDRKAAPAAAIRSHRVKPLGRMSYVKWTPNVRQPEPFVKV